MEAPTAQPQFSGFTGVPCTTQILPNSWQVWCHTTHRNCFAPDSVGRVSQCSKCVSPGPVPHKFFCGFPPSCRADQCVTCGSSKPCDSTLLAWQCWGETTHPHTYTYRAGRASSNCANRPKTTINSNWGVGTQTRQHAMHGPYTGAIHFKCWQQTVRQQTVPGQNPSEEQPLPGHQVPHTLETLSFREPGPSPHSAAHTAILHVCRSLTHGPPMDAVPQKNLHLKFCSQLQGRSTHELCR